ncbi:MAG TPA: hypothetical protein VNJ08_02480 [Bacteriovoracaceae bacterium]|nr:hypothetical protein [Bacteriovoracaceae bacterium]
MKSKNDEATQRVLMLLKIDAKNVFNRIKSRKLEYLEIFALRRTREHFPTIFKNRYETTSIMDLAHCTTDLINSLDQFYGLVDDLSWYMFQTEDMPNTVEDYVDRKIIRMERVLGTLNLFLDAELGISGVDAASMDEEKQLFIDQPEEHLFAEPWEDDKPQES